MDLIFQVPPQEAARLSKNPNLTVTVLGLNLLGDGLRDVLDPRTGVGS